jgi:hypothetical protein
LRDDDAVVGAIAIAVGLVVVLPAGFMLGGAVASALMGWLLARHAEDAHPGSELIALNR